MIGGPTRAKTTTETVQVIIVLIHWKIKPDRVEDFLCFWKKKATVDNRRGLVGEFLTEAHSSAEYPWITWHLTGCEGKYRSFINVGYWAYAEDFREQVDKYFDTSTGVKCFEFEPRVRTVLKPQCWRLGDAPLPIHDSGGVL